MFLRTVAVVLTVLLPVAAVAQAPACVAPNGRQVVIYRAGSLTGAFKPLIDRFTCETGVQVKDLAMGSVDAGRQITAGGQACDLYAPADDSVIDLFMKPAGYAAYTIVFARGKMVLAYSAKSLEARKLPSLAEPASGQAGSPGRIPKAAAKWYEILSSPGFRIGAGHPFLDPGAYRANLVFQLAEVYYRVPNLYNNLLGHVVIAGPGRSGSALGDLYDAQFIYEHSVRELAKANPDIRYVDLPDEINLSDPGKNAYYAQHALVALPGLGTPASARTIPVPATRVAWGITVMKHAPNPADAIRFLELLLGPTGTAMLAENGPTPIAPALVGEGDLGRLPRELRPLVKTTVRASTPSLR
jgi:molybdate/tungstate transport system substrate-binding protein